MAQKLFRVKWREQRTCFADVFAMDEDGALDKLYYGDIRESDIDVDKEDIQEILSVSEVHD